MKTPEEIKKIMEWVEKTHPRILWKYSTKEGQEALCGILKEFAEAYHAQYTQRKVQKHVCCVDESCGQAEQDEMRDMFPEEQQPIDRKNTVPVEQQTCKTYEIDFAGNVKVKLIITENGIEIDAAMNGWGNPIEPSKCKIERI